MTERDPAAEFAERFRIPLDLLEALGVRHATDAEVRELLAVHGRAGQDLAGIVFPYLDPRDGRVVSYRVRLDTPLAEGQKYLSSPGCRHLFFASISGSALSDSSVIVVIVEAEKSALALTALADRCGRRLLAVAIGGAWGWRRKIGNRPLPNGGTEPETGPSPDLDLISWKNRTAILAFDSNASTNPDVRKARLALAQELAARGASISIADVSSEPGINGPDDLVAIAGDAAMVAVLNTARPFAECVLAEAEQSLAALEGDKKSDPLPAIEAIAAVEDATRRALLAGQLAALRIPAVNKGFIEQQIASRRSEAATARKAAAEAAKRGRLASMEIDPAGLIAELEDYFSARVWHPTHAAVHATLVNSLFVVLTYCTEHFSAVPYLCLESATPGCGKSTVLDLLSLVVFEPLPSAGLSRAALVRRLDERRATLLLDESEWLAGHGEAAETIRGVLHAGYRRGATYQLCEGDDHEVRDFQVFGPKVFCAVGGLTGALLDRCIILHMEKAPANVTLLSASLDDAGPVAAPLREKLEAFALQVRERLEALMRGRPAGGYWPEFRNREAELWHPLLTIARACGSGTERRALEAARILAKAKQSIQADERRVAQAAELVDVLRGMNCETFRPADLVEHLELAETWGEVLSKKEGPRLKAAAIGRYLASFRIPSRDRQRSGSTYDRLETLEIIARHTPFPHPEKSATGATGATGPVKMQVPDVAPGGGGVSPVDSGVSHGNPHKQGVRGTVAPVAPDPGVAKAKPEEDL